MYRRLPLYGLIVCLHRSYDLHSFISPTIAPDKRHTWDLQVVLPNWCPMGRIMRTNFFVLPIVIGITMDYSVRYA